MDTTGSIKALAGRDVITLQPAHDREECAEPVVQLTGCGNDMGSGEIRCRVIAGYDNGDERKTSFGAFLAYLLGMEDRNRIEPVPKGRPGRWCRGRTAHRQSTGLPALRGDQTW